ncbi:MAG: dephospho-CoA kinase [Bryobacteraceae bacterium]
MLRVGLTGGLATGKSFVGRLLAGLGCHLLQADQIGHELLQPAGDAFAPVVSEFGASILALDGSIDRRRLGAEVFGNPERLAVLNSLIHPHVVKREEEWLGEVEAADPDGIAVIEAAILVETGSFRRFQKLILTVCSEEEQVRRAMGRDHLTEDEVRDRLKRQMPLEEKRKYADYIIDTSAAKSHTEDQVKELHKLLTLVC